MLDVVTRFWKYTPKLDSVQAILGFLKLKRITKIILPNKIISGTSTTMQTRSRTDTQLKQQTKDTPKFSFTGQTVTAKVVYVVDGDTVDVVFNFQDKFQKFRLRLNGINTPETKGIERPPGLYVKQYVNNDLLDKIVTLKLYHFDNLSRQVRTRSWKLRKHRQIQHNH